MVDPGCPPPHAWGSAKQALMVRYFLLMEYGGKCGLEPGKRELLLFPALSPAWVMPGKSVSIVNSPTEFGRISASIGFTDTGAEISIKKQFHSNPADFRIRIPWFKELTGFKTDAKTHKMENGCIVLSPDASRVKIRWRDKPGAGKGTENNILLDYRSEDRFTGVDKDGKAIIEQGKPFLTPSERKDEDKIQLLSFALVRAAFQHEYSRRAEACVKNGGVLTEVRPPAMLTSDQRKQLYEKAYAK
jgi:hypothetical protein